MQSRFDDDSWDDTSSWRIETTDLHGMGEVFDNDERLVLIDPCGKGEGRARAHARAHIKLGHSGRRRFTDAQETQAEVLAQGLVELDATHDPRELTETADEQ